MNLSSEKTYFASKKFRVGIFGIVSILTAFAIALVAIHFTPECKKEIEEVFVAFTRSACAITIVYLGGQSTVDFIADKGKVSK